MDFAMMQEDKIDEAQRKKAYDKHQRHFVLVIKVMKVCNQSESKSCTVSCLRLFLLELCRQLFCDSC